MRIIVHGATPTLRMIIKWFAVYTQFCHAPLRPYWSHAWRLKLCGKDSRSRMKSFPPAFSAGCCFQRPSNGFRSSVVGMTSSIYVQSTSSHLCGDCFTFGRKMGYLTLHHDANDGWVISPTKNESYSLARNNVGNNVDHLRTTQAMVAISFAVSQIRCIENCKNTWHILGNTRCSVICVFS